MANLLFNRLALLAELAYIAYMLCRVGITTISRMAPTENA